jgi:hypothetical protein
MALRRSQPPLGPSIASGLSEAKGAAFAAQEDVPETPVASLITVEIDQTYRQPSGIITERETV